MVASRAARVSLVSRGEGGRGRGPCRGSGASAPLALHRTRQLLLLVARQLSAARERLSHHAYAPPTPPRAHVDARRRCSHVSTPHPLLTPPHTSSTSSHACSPHPDSHSHMPPPQPQTPTHLPVSSPAHTPLLTYPQPQHLPPFAHTRRPPQHLDSFPHVSPHYLTSPQHRPILAPTLVHTTIGRSPCH